MGLEISYGAIHTLYISILPRQIFTWPPGLAPEPNCDTQICCKEGSTHLPSQNITGIMTYPPEFLNNTVWYQLKKHAGSNVGAMNIIYSKDNGGIDPKKCYRTKELEPAAYRCTHLVPHNVTHKEYNDIIFNPSLSTGDRTKPKPFV